MPFTQRKIPLEEHSKIRDRLQGKEYMQDIALDYGVSREYIRQLAKKWGLTGINAKNRSREKFQKKDEWFKLKYGLSYTQKEARKEDIFKACLDKYRLKKANAKASGLEFTIQFAEIDWPTHCPILGIELDYFSEGRMENSPSFDRLDSSKGYISRNVIIVSWRANRIKNNGTAEEHRMIADYIDRLNHTTLDSQDKI